MAKRVSPAITGFVTGVRFAAKSLEPSLMPRSAVDQGLIMGGSFLTGFLTGTAAGSLANLLPLPRSGPSAKAFRMMVASAGSARTLTAIDPSTPPPVDEREAWAEMGGEVASALALTGLGGSGPKASLASAGALAASTAIEAKAAIDRRQDSPDLKYLLTSVGVAVGLNVAVAAAAGVVVLGARLAANGATRPFPRGVVAVGGAAATVAAMAAGARIGVGTVLSSMARGNRALEVAYTERPEAVTMSGNRYSLTDWETLGVQGRRLVSEYTPIDDIEAVMGGPARVAPVRVYVGVGTADSEDDRIELAIHELRRAGGFDRSLIIAASPAGTGYVNYIAIEAAELMARGDVATVAVQYGEVPSMLSIDKVPAAARVYGKLLTRLREEIDALGRDIRLAAYGESLGAITGQIGVWRASQRMGRTVVDDSLWVGTPQGSPLFEELTAQGVPVFDHFDDVRAYLASGNDVPEVVFLNHDNDPVTRFHPSVAFRMPEWLKTTARGRNVEPHQRWLPGISFWQGLIDTKNAATVVPGEFFSTGHDYRADLAEFVRFAYGFDDVDDEQMVQIEARLRQSEVTRADNIAEGKVVAPAP
jgi:uncharacterized membrane protein